MISPGLRRRRILSGLTGIVAAVFSSGSVRAQAVDLAVQSIPGVEITQHEGFAVFDHRVLVQHGRFGSSVSVVSAQDRQDDGRTPRVDDDRSSCGLQLGSMQGLSRSTLVRRRIYGSVVREAECRHGLPRGLLDALIVRESRYRVIALSPMGARGLTQLMPGTARDLGVRNRLDPVSNIGGGARYLRGLIDHFRSIPLALAAYNAGPHAVERAGGMPFNRETPGYVVDILRRWNATVFETGSIEAGVPTVAGSALVHMDFGER
jgi:hypothetical protein